MSGDVIVIGDALIDELRSPHGSLDAPGGSAVNVAVGLSLLGLRPTLIAMVGDDPDGDSLRAHLAAFGVSLLASASPHGTGRAISNRINGEPTYSFNSPARHRRIQFDEAMLATLGSAAIVAVSGYPFDDSEQVQALDAAIRPVSNLLLVDPNPRLGMMTERERFGDNLQHFAARCDLVKLGDEDSQLLHSLPVSEAAAAYLGWGAGVVLATEGGHGATVHEPRFTAHADITSDARPIIDTMGAGDATFAAVVASSAQLGRLPSGREWDSVLQRAMAIAAETIRVAGGTLQQPDMSSPGRNGT
jgi:fructokinase